MKKRPLAESEDTPKKKPKTDLLRIIVYLIFMVIFLFSKLSEAKNRVYLYYVIAGVTALALILIAVKAGNAARSKRLKEEYGIGKVKAGEDPEPEEFAEEENTETEDSGTDETAKGQEAGAEEEAGEETEEEPDEDGDKYVIVEPGRKTRSRRPGDMYSERPEGQFAFYILLTALIIGIFSFYVMASKGMFVPKAPKIDTYQSTSYGLREEYGMVNGRKYGPFKRFYKSGSLESEGFYVNGMLEGERISYNEAGFIERVSTYEEGVLAGEERYYNKEGKLTISQVSFFNPYRKKSRYYSEDNGPTLERFVDRKYPDYEAGSNWVRKGAQFTRFYGDGTVTEQGTYKIENWPSFTEKLVPDGMWSYFSDKGIIYEEKVYNKGTLIKTLHFDSTGKPTDAR